MDDLEKRRRERNDDIVRRFKRGEALLGNPESTWFPPRPSIKKDTKLVASLYCTSGHTLDDSGRCTVCGSCSDENKVVLRVIE